MVRDLQPTQVVPPSDVLAALTETPEAEAAWDDLAPSYRRTHVKHIERAKRPETRQRRIAKLVDSLLPTGER